MFSPFFVLVSFHFPFISKELTLWIFSKTA